VIPLPVDPYLRWSHQFPDWLRAQVAVADNVAAAASLDGTVKFLTADSGEILWAANLRAPVRSAVLLLSTAGGTAYAGDAEGGLHMMDMRSKEHRVLFHAPGPFVGPPVTAAEGVFALSADGCIYRIDARTSNHQVLYQMGEPVVGVLAVADGVVFAATARGSIQAIDIDERRARWRLNVGGLVHAAPVAVGGWLYFSGTDGLLWSVGIADHRERTTVKIGVPVHAALRHDGGRLYAGGSDGVVHAFDVSGDYACKPEELWPQPPKVGDEVSGVTLAHGSVYAAADGMLVELDGISGRPERRIPVASSVTAAPVAAGNFVYVAGLDGVVSCLSMT
jgi:outer membrane protein assembly factor BamB